MEAREAAERYIKGFYCRPDSPSGKERDWMEYRELELEGLVPVFEEMENAGCEFLSVGHMYTSTQGVTAQIVFQFPEGDHKPMDRTYEYFSNANGGKKMEHWVGPHAPWPAWMKNFLTRLIGEQGNALYPMPDWSAKSFNVMKIIINESCLPVERIRR